MSEEAFISDSVARMNLLNRVAPEGYSSEWMERLRSKPDEEARDTVAALVFRVAAEWVALPVGALAEITADAPVHRVPHRSNEVLRGIVNVRGELQLAFSLRALLGLEEGSAPQLSAGRVHARMIMLVRDGQRFVTRVDEVPGVVHFEKRKEEAVPVTVSKSLATYTRSLYSWRGRKIALLDDELIFHSLLNQYL